MKVKQRFSIIFLAILAMLCAIVGVSTIKTNAVYATDQVTFKMAGAQARIYGKNQEDYGIRFRASVPVEDINDKFYVMIIPVTWLEKYELTEGCDYYKILVEEKQLEEGKDIIIMPTIPKLDDKDGIYYASGSITNIKYSNSYREFFGIVYKTETDGSGRCYAELNDNVRSISQIASSQLNRTDIVLEDEEREYYNISIKNAYNAINGISEDAQHDLPVISSAIENMVVSKGTKFDLEPLNIPDGIGIKTLYVTENETAISIDENGGATALADSGSVALTARVLGVNYTKTVKLRPAMADNMLEDFNSELSKDNVQYNVWSNCNDGGFSGAYHETYNGATGVVEIIGHEAGSSMTPIRFNKTEQELLEILQKSESITYRVYVEENVWFVPVGQSGFVLKNADGWKDVVVTKTQLLSDTTLEEFAKNHCNTGSGKGNTFSRANNGGKIFIDSITFNEYQPAIELDTYTLPTTAGVTFTLPTATLKKGDLVIDDAEVTVTATVQARKLNGNQPSAVVIAVSTVEGVRLVKTYTGTTTITYSCEYQGQTYTKVITYTIGTRAAMASDMLEDFDDPLSAYSASSNRSADLTGNWWPATWLDNFDNAYGVIRICAVNSTYTPNPQLAMRFNRTTEELTQILATLDKVTVRVYKDGEGTGWLKFFGKDCGALAKGWNEKTITKDELLNGMTEADFAAKYSNSGDGKAAIQVNGTTTSGAESIYYFDYISFTSTAVAE